MSFPFSEPPDFGRTISITPGLLWLRAPLPITLGHINLWLFEEKESWVSIDAGFGYEGGKLVWEELFQGFLKEKRLRRLLVTHYHADHAGLADWLSQRFDVTPEMSALEWAMGRAFAKSWRDEEEKDAAVFYRRTGATGKLLSFALARHRSFDYEFSGYPAQFRSLQEGAKIKAGAFMLEVALASGHSPLMACFIDKERKLFFSGDQILSHINTSMILMPFEENANPLAQYFSSLDRFAELGDDMLVLPSHGLPFYGLHARIDRLRRHHQDRLERTLSALSHPLHAADLIEKIFRRRLDERQHYFALIETLAHLHYLLDRGDIHQTQDKDGIFIYYQN